MVTEIALDRCPTRTTCLIAIRRWTGELRLKTFPQAVAKTFRDFEGSAVPHQADHIPRSVEDGETRIPEMLQRVRQRLDAVFEDAMFHELCSTNPARAKRSKISTYTRSSSPGRRPTDGAESRVRTATSSSFHRT